MRWSIITLMLLSLACSKKDTEPTAETEQAAQPEAAAPSVGNATAEDPNAEVPKPLNSPELPDQLKTPAAPVDAAPVVTVLDQGQEPRQARSWDIKPGFEQQRSLVVGFSIDAFVAALRVGEPVYLTTYELTFRAGEAQADGSVPVTFSVDKATIDFRQIGQQRVERIKTALATANQLTGSYTLGPRGRITAVEMKVPADARRTGHDMADNLRWAILHVVPVFPEEPIGKGAKWTVNEAIQQGGIHVNQLTTIELVATKGNRVDLSLRVQQSAAKQRFENPGLPLPQRLTLLNTVSDGTLTWDLTELAPRDANITANITKAVEQSPDDPKKKIEVIISETRALNTPDQ